MAKEYILKDRYGKDHTYNDEKIYVRGTDGELMPFTQGTVEPLTITENGTYTAPDGVNGYNPVTVSVEGGNDVRYVTFMSHDGLIEYGKKAVAVGDDCADPIARGVFDTPTRESDAQYNYTFYGWATTPNGAADSSALKAVEEDRTVYANFASAVRYYTITYYDSDGTTVLKTESLAYGTMPSYAPTKENYMFGGWTPSAVSVTGNASYTAVWEEKVTFATASWPKITEITTAGTSASNFSVGDTRKETLTYSDGTTEEIELIIAKIRSNGTMVLALNHALNTQKPMHSSASSCVANYFKNDLGNYLVNTVLPAFPVEFSEALRENDLMFAKRKIRLLTQYNVEDNNTGQDNSDVEYERLPLFAKAANRIRKINGTAVTYWTGSYNKPSTSLNYYFGYINTSGVYTTQLDAVTGNKGVVFLVDV